jgi:hypothetical protein
MTTPFDHVVTTVRPLDVSRKVILLHAVAAAAAVLLAGCATDAAPRGSGYVISTATAQFYKNGPAQDFTFAQHTFDNNITQQKVGPDFDLPKGAHVTMLKREFGYSRVVTDDGVAGYVSNDQLKPAPAVARVVPTGLPAERPYRERVRSHPQPRQLEERPLDMSDLPLPLPG